MSQPLRKAVILAAGLNSRFLPMTKAVPKAMLPIVDKPVIQYLVEEAISAGIKDILIVTGRGRSAIEDHFSYSAELAQELKIRGKKDILEKIEAIENLANFSYIHQEDPHGDGHALLCAKDWINGKAFAVLFGDDLVDHPKSALSQLKEVFDKVQAPVIAVQEVSLENISAYGVVDPASSLELPLKGLVEKPQPADAPSNLGIIGKYICTPDILTHLEKLWHAKPDGELRLIDGLRARLSSNQTLHAVKVLGHRYDTGHLSGWLQANLAFAMKDPELKAHLQETWNKANQFQE
jgi:UTP--glucose-1-phosphate uridylyltransferase